MSYHLGNSTGRLSVTIKLEGNYVYINIKDWSLGMLPKTKWHIVTVQDSHVGDHEQKYFYLLGTKFHFHKIKVKMSTVKTDQTTWKRLRYTISTGQYQSSAGLLEKTTNIQNIYYCKIINRSYMVWRGKVWLLKKKTEKKIKITLWLYWFVTFVHSVLDTNRTALSRGHKTKDCRGKSAMGTRLG